MKNYTLSSKYLWLYAFIAGFLLTLTPFSLAISHKDSGQMGFHLVDSAIFLVLSITMFYVSLWFNLRLLGKPVYKKILFNLLIYIALSWLAILIHQPVWMKMQKLPLIFFIRDEFIRNLIVFSISFIVAHAMDTFRQNQLMKDKIIEIQQQNLAGQLETLKQQINPHFFFNSMNTLSGLAKEDPNKTVDFIDKLSLIFRYVLDIQEKNLVPLSEELRFARAYIFLLEVRFSDKLVIDLNLDENDSDLVPSLCSQLLLENIIKHNSMTNQNPVKIEFRKEDGYFVVSNTLAPKKDTAGAGIGLKNLDARSRLLIGKPIEVTGTGQHFTVKIPVKAN